MNSEAAVALEDVSFRYPKTSSPALDGLTLEVGRSEIFGLLGPNGSGKTTLFRILTTSLRPSAGFVSVLGIDLRACPQCVRSKIGVVFQHPALDSKLTVAENLSTQGHLYGLSGKALDEKIGQMLELFGLKDCRGEKTEKLSGGFRRRVEIAKSLLHEPGLLIMDEPSSGLDPSVRTDLWAHLKNLKEKKGTTIILTTHLMDEADQCSRLAILNAGRLIALGAPHDLKGEVGGDVVRLETPSPEDLRTAIKTSLGLDAQLIGNQVRLEVKRGHEFVPKLFSAFAGQINSVMLSKPTLEDVFIHHTGQAFKSNGENRA